jgi:hypothetical protein
MCSADGKVDNTDFFTIEYLFRLFRNLSSYLLAFPDKEDNWSPLFGYTDHDGKISNFSNLTSGSASFVY